MIRVADYIFRRLAERGITQAFLVTGGGAMHLDDALGRSDRMAWTCNHHEQACAMAAEGYARVSGRPAAVVVTSGPGATNAVTGLVGQWLDSIPCIYLSGQLRLETTIESCRHLGLRQLGDQEINITDIVRPVTKFCAVVRRPQDIGPMLERAVSEATGGRPGPVWLDIPLDVQAALVDEDALEVPPQAPGSVQAEPRLVEAAAELIRKARRPVLLAGHGIRLSGCRDDLIDLAELIGIPVVTSLGGFDLVPSDHHLFAGRAGTLGTRSGSYALQNADLLLSIGTRNNIRQVSYDWTAFCRNAVKIIVDIDPAELGKPTVRPDLAVPADAGAFLRDLSLLFERRLPPDWLGWWNDCRTKRDELAAVYPDESCLDGTLHPNCFVELLTGMLPRDAVVVSGNGTASIALYQSGRVAYGQRMFVNSGCAAMGYDLPAAIGACLARGRRDVVCITGDGSIQMNIQELQTIAHHQLPVKIFVLNNGGYSSIRQTQDRYFARHHVGADRESGVGFPDMLRIAKAYGISAAAQPRHPFSAEAWIDDVLTKPGPVLAEVMVPRDHVFDRVAIAAPEAVCER